MKRNIGKERAVVYCKEYCKSDMEAGRRRIADLLIQMNKDFFDINIPSIGKIRMISFYSRCEGYTYQMHIFHMNKNNLLSRIEKHNLSDIEYNELKDIGYGNYAFAN